MYSIELSEYARQDIRDATLWYRNQQHGLDEIFLTSLKSSLKLIEQNPLLFQTVIKTVRATILHKFPYRIVYNIGDAKIMVLGVIHMKRNPKLISKRLK